MADKPDLTQMEKEIEKFNKSGLKKDANAREEPTSQQRRIG